jgi:hypothetical protein
MATIFCYFGQFSAIFANFLRFLPIFCEKMAFISKTNVMIKFLQKLAVLRAKKRQYFSRNFSAKIFFLNHDIGPWSPCLETKFRKDPYVSFQLTWKSSVDMFAGRVYCGHFFSVFFLW